MWVRARPKAEHDALLISFVRMMYKRDIQLLLHLGIVLSMPFREAKQRLVARVLGKRVCKLMVRGQIDAQPTKSFKECSVIAVEQITETNPPRIGTPFQEQIEEVSSSSAQGQIQRAVRLQVEIVAITHKKQDQRLVPCFERDLPDRCAGRQIGWSASAVYTQPWSTEARNGAKPTNEQVYLHVYVTRSPQSIAGLAPGGCGEKLILGKSVIRHTQAARPRSPSARPPGLRRSQSASGVKRRHSALDYLSPANC